MGFSFLVDNNFVKSSTKTTWLNKAINLLRVKTSISLYTTSLGLAYFYLAASVSIHNHFFTFSPEKRGNHCRILLQVSFLAVIAIVALISIRTIPGGENGQYALISLPPQGNNNPVLNTHDVTYAIASGFKSKEVCSYDALFS